jgi:hypothetical protein
MRAQKIMLPGGKVVSLFVPMAPAASSTVKHQQGQQAAKVGARPVVVTPSPISSSKVVKDSQRMVMTMAAGSTSTLKNLQSHDHILDEINLEESEADDDDMKEDEEQEEEEFPNSKKE